MLNIVIPMAGRGSRFAEAGYELPKPLIPVLGTPMIKLVIENLTPECDHRFIFLCLDEHLKKYDLGSRLKEWCCDPVIITVDVVTEGAACTVLLAEKFIDNDDAMMIANCDQWVDLDINDYLNEMKCGGYDGYIMTMNADHPKWSYVKFGEEEKIIEVVEKQVVSNEATVGIYNYKKGRDFVDAAKTMIKKNLRVNGEFYVAPAYNEMIELGQNIGFYNIGSEFNGMYGLGIPDDLIKFEKKGPMVKA